MIKSERLAILRPKELAPLAVGVADGARMLGISRRNLQGMIARGEIPSVPCGGRRLLRVATLDAWLVAREEGATSEGAGQAGDQSAA